jgi:hypothetical protein
MRNGIHVIQFVHLLPGISELSPGRLSVVVSTATPRKPASGWKSEVKRGSPCLYTYFSFSCRRHTPLVTFSFWVALGHPRTQSGLAWEKL